MSLKLGAHQPNHWPYLGFIDKMRMSDVFIIYDTAQFVRKDFHQRNRIRVDNPDGFRWFTVPVEKKVAPIRDIVINNDHIQYERTWYDVHKCLFMENYKTAKYYDDHIDFLDKLYGKRWDWLIDMNLAIIDYLRDVFDIRTRVLLSSEMDCFKYKDYSEVSVGELENADPHYVKNYIATLKIIDMCHEVDADTFISGVSGRDYLVTGLFGREGIKLEYQSFEHPVYRQCFSPFVPNLSALDYIMNVDVSSSSSSKSR